MSDMKCPFCGEKLEPYYGYGIELYSCSNLACKGTNMKAEDSVWQELIRTRKALDAAVDALKWIAYDENDEQDGLEEFAISQILEKADEALKQITALEQKD